MASTRLTILDEHAFVVVKHLELQATQESCSIGLQELGLHLLELRQAGLLAREGAEPLR